ncbi:hypothetical protein M3Y98_00711700 [Aphelenchoides besseyi]|nr:hypothetical protein M3Y98_00711700 [Aphelenchoides besseyi]KAI6210323.1 hypothetical protein M3Y96_00316000 [Aphelenchoides besseyi]
MRRSIILIALTILLPLCAVPQTQYAVVPPHFAVQRGAPVVRPSGKPLRVQPQGRAFGYNTQGAGPVAVQPQVVSAGVESSCSVGQSGCSSPAGDFNSVLSGGVIGGAGIKARINQRGFQYASTLIAPILDQQIRQARIPPISQCVPEVNGCIQAYNLFISRYRCPQRVVLYPAPPNQIVIAVQNMDIGITGNLGGQINILIPIAVTGIIQVNIHQISATVALAVDRTPTGGIALRMVSCQITVGYLDAYIQNGGLVGDIANSQFRGRISSMIKSMLPSQVCGQLPTIINQQINSKLTSIPQTIALNQIISIASGAFGLDQLASGGQCASSCGGSTGVNAAPQQTQLPAPAQPVAPAPVPQRPYANPPQPAAPVAPVQSKGPSAPPTDYQTQNNVNPPGYSTNSKKVSRVLASGVTRAEVRPLARPDVRLVSHTSKRASIRPKRQTALARPRAFAPSPNHVIFPDPNAPNPCTGCPSSGGSESPTSFLLTLAKSLDLNKLNNLHLTIQLLQTYATTNDFTIELNGEFSPGGQGGTPFGPFPMQFPYATGTKMAEALISDYTLNSLFYWMHRVGFLTFRIGPETPKIGELLKTTCSDDEDEGAIEDHGVELDDESNSAIRKKRQDDEGGSLADLGICFGDILPALREKYPNQKIVINIHTAQAPSVVLSSRNGGSATITLNADADLHIESTNEKVGTINVNVVADITISTKGGRLSGHAEITQLQLRDTTGALGLPQDALDNLGNLGKEVIQKAGNDALEKGIALNIPSNIGGLPINLVDPELQIVDHAIYVASDFTVDPSGLQSLLGTSGGGGGGGSCSAGRRKKLH